MLNKNIFPNPRGLVYNKLMAVRNIPIVNGEFYHIFNRGNGKHEIFLDEKDYERFTKLLYLCNSTKKLNFREDIVLKDLDVWNVEREEPLVFIGAWVLMPNHFHLYITPNPRGLGNVVDNTKNNISIFMGRLCNAYVKYFNRKYGRSGSLFEGPFKSVHVSLENQAMHLFTYIHLNPIKLIQKDWKEVGILDKEKTLNFLDHYKWNSYQDFSGKTRNENLILNRENFLSYFDTSEAFKKGIFEWLKIPNPWGLGEK